MVPIILVLCRLRLGHAFWRSWNASCSYICCGASLDWWISTNELCYFTSISNLARIGKHFWHLLNTSIITHAYGIRGGSMVFTSVCLSVFPHNSLKTNAARITKQDVEMFHADSWKLNYFEVKRSTSLVSKALLAWLFALLWVLASSSCNLPVDFAQCVVLLCSIIVALLGYAYVVSRAGSN